MMREGSGHVQAFPGATPKLVGARPSDRLRRRPKQPAQIIITCYFLLAGSSGMIDYRMFVHLQSFHCSHQPKGFMASSASASLTFRRL